MKLYEFLRYKTRAEELCVICDPWRVAAVWIDHEDLFLRYVHPDLCGKEVIKDDWAQLETKTDKNETAYIDAHYIYI